MTDRQTGVIRPVSLRAQNPGQNPGQYSAKIPGRTRGGAMAIAGLTAAFVATGAQAQEAGPPANEDEVVLETLRIEDATADINPNAQPGVPYKARTSGDVRRIKPLSETPQTIQVITEQQIEEQGATDLKDLLDNVPGVTIGTGENGNAFGDRYIIRGHEARSDVFVDGLRDPGMTTRETFAVDQIEITKGPSSSFAGRGSTGGAVNSITKKASTDYQFTRVDAGIGTDDFYRVTLDANLPLSDTLAVRANLLYGREDVPGRGFSDRERYGAAISAAFRPSDVFEVVLDYYHLTADDTPDLGGYVPRPTGTGPDDVVVYEPWDEVPNYTQAEDFLNSDVDTATARIYVTPFEGFSVVNSTRYGETSNGYVLTGLRGGAVDPTTQTFAPLTLSTHQGNQEVEYFVNQFNVIGQFATGGLMHNLIAGAEYSDLAVANGTYQLTTNGTPNCRTSGTGPNNNFCITDSDRNVLFDDDAIHNLTQRSVGFGIVDSDWSVETLSFYLMDTVDVTPWLSLHGGVRVDAFSYENVVVQGGNATGYVYSDTLWNGHAGVGIKPTDEVFVYFNYGTAKNINGGESDLGGNCGYGGICVADGVAISDGRPESTESFEIGVKADLFDDRFLVTAAAFQITKGDVFESAVGGQIPSGPDGTGGGVDYSPVGALNTGENRVRGLEFGLVGTITPKLLAQAALTLMDSEIRDSNDPTKIGRKLSNFADTQFSGQLRYQLTDTIAFGGTATYKGEMFTGQPDDAASYDTALQVYAYRVPDYWTFDAFASVDLNRNLAARVNVTNIANEDYYVAGYRSGHFLYKGDERRATLTLTGKF